MVLPWFGVIVDKNVDPERILKVRQTACTDPASQALPANFPAQGLPTLSIPRVILPKK